MTEQVDLLLAEVLGVPVTAITDDLAMKDLDAWDSLRHVELVVALERGLGLEFTMDEIVAMQSVGAIRRVLGEKAPS